MLQIYTYGFCKNQRALHVTRIYDVQMVLQAGPGPYPCIVLDPAIIHQLLLGRPASEIKDVSTFDHRGIITKEAYLFAWDLSHDPDFAMKCLNYAPEDEQNLTKIKRFIEDFTPTAGCSTQPAEERSDPL